MLSLSTTIFNKHHPSAAAAPTSAPASTSTLSSSTSATPSCVALSGVARCSRPVSRPSRVILRVFYSMAHAGQAAIACVLCWPVTIKLWRVEAMRGIAGYLGAMPLAKHSAAGSLPMACMACQLRAVTLVPVRQTCGVRMVGPLDSGHSPWAAGVLISRAVPAESPS